MVGDGAGGGRYGCEVVAPQGVGEPAHVVTEVDHDGEEQAGIGRGDRADGEIGSLCGELLGSGAAGEGKNEKREEGAGAGGKAVHQCLLWVR